MQRLSTTTSFTVFTELCPFVNCDHPSVTLLFESLTQKPFHKTCLKYKALSGNVHRTSTITLPTFLMELCPFVNFSMCLLNNSDAHGDIFLKLGTNIKGHQMIETGCLTLPIQGVSKKTWTFYEIGVISLIFEESFPNFVWSQQNNTPLLWKRFYK